MAARAKAERERVAALAAQKFGARVTHVAALVPGLGRRRFYRVRFDGAPGTAIARVDACEDPAARAAGTPPEPPLAEIRALLEAHALPVPKSFGASENIEWLEDLGDTNLCSFAKHAPRAEAERLAREALGALPRLQSIAPVASVPAFARRMNRAMFSYKAQLFARESLPLVLGREARATERAATERAFAYIAALAEAAPARLAHRDFQSRNLMVRTPEEPAHMARARGDETHGRSAARDTFAGGEVPRGGGPQRHSTAREGGRPSLVWIDLQGALLAPPEYDAVCLLRDSYLEWDEAFVAASCERLRTRLPDAPAREAFALRFDALTLSRKAKDHARFLYIARTNAGSHTAHEDEARGAALMSPANAAPPAARVLEDLPRTVRHLQRAARNLLGHARELDPLCEWLLALPENSKKARA